jgi:hypothetical protein
LKLEEVSKAIGEGVIILNWLDLTGYELTLFVEEMLQAQLLMMMMLN